MLIQVMLENLLKIYNFDVFHLPILKSDHGLNAIPSYVNKTIDMFIITRIYRQDFV